MAIIAAIPSMRCVVMLTANAIQKIIKIVCKLAASKMIRVVVLTCAVLQVRVVAPPVIAAVLVQSLINNVAVCLSAVLPIKPVVMPMKAVVVSLNTVILIPVALAVHPIDLFLV